MAFDAFLNIDGIPGESTDDAHGDWIEIISFDHCLKQQSTASRSDQGNLTAGRVDHGEFIIKKKVDKTSPKLALTCCNGRHIPLITMELCRADENKEKYLEVKMSDAIVTCWKPKADKSEGEDLPTEEVRFAYSKIEWTYTQFDSKGKSKGQVAANWDLTINKGG